MKILYSWITIFVLQFLPLINQSVAAVEDIPSTLIAIEADDVTFDNAHNQVLASGNVVIEYQDYTVTASLAKYDKQNDVLFLKNNVTLVNKIQNNIYYAQYAEIRQKEGKIQIYDFKSKLDDDKITAESSSIGGIDKDHYTFNEVSVTPCKICAENFVPNQPLWRVRAKRMRVNFKEDKIVYDNLNLEMWGKKILYVPYFTTPSFNTKYKSGFLIPKVYGGRYYGFAIALPYYMNFSQSFDATITPYLTTKKRILDLEVRGVSERGGYVLNLGAAKDPGTKSSNASKRIDPYYAGYISASGNWLLSKNVSKGNKSYANVNKSLELGFDIRLLFDKSKTYFKKYQLKYDDILMNKGYINIFDEDFYALLMLDGIQDLRTIGYSETIVGAPRLRLQKRFDLQNIGNSNITLPSGSYGMFKLNAMNLIANKFIKYRSLDAEFSASIPLIFEKGQIIELIPSLSTYAYTKSNANDDSKKENINQKKNALAIFTPGVTLSFRWPWLMNRIDKDKSHFIDNYSGASKNSEIKLSGVLIEPVLNFRLQPRQTLYPSDFIRRFVLPNAYEILNPTISSKNFDQEVGGSSMQYGIKTSYFLNNGNSIDFMLAKSYRFYRFNREQSEINDQISGLSIYHGNSRSSGYTFYSAFRDSRFTVENKLWFKSKGMYLARSETIISYLNEGGKFNYSFGHIFTDYKYYNIDKINYNNEIFVNLWYNLHKKWWLNFQTKRKIGKKEFVVKDDDMTSQKISQGLGLRYKDDCLQVDFSVNREYLKSKGLLPATRYVLSLSVPILDSK